jgi:site-specific recombinase XerC
MNAVANVAGRAVFERYLTERDEKLLLRHVGKFSDPLAARDHAWMRLLRQTGIRVGSLAGLTVEDAQEAIASGRLRVRDEIAKGGRGYFAGVNSAAKTALRDLLRIRRAMGFPPVPTEPLILSRRGQGMSVRSYQSRMAEWAREAGLTVVASPHWFRHTLAKRIVARSTSNDPLGLVQVVLGQRTRAAASIYALPDREDVDRALELAR